MKRYLLAKLSEINYRMAIHVGDANRRLASESIKILLLPSLEVPQKYKNQFNKLRALIQEASKDCHDSTSPAKFYKIQNRTAVKYIQMLLDIERDLRD